MDDIVKQALAKWPNVPACYGWLGLDARGRWYLRDDATQALGPFARSRGTLLAHEKLIAFIHRNYEVDAQGCWFFQNGPQRVYVELEATPHIWRLQPDGGVQSHTGQPAQVRSAWLDAEGHFYLDTDIGFGLVHSADMAAVADAVEQGRWTPQEMAGSDLPARFGFVRSPQALQAVRGPA